ncbi:Coronin-2B [Labeo rohita]|uniref:Coronin n=1 Tax=Labeo rohita TaxID=84645 RepID=A0ABQ8N099_LABRO|nr:Coronin-2B [Labeo rohita]
MTWRPQYRSSKYRHVFGKPATKENCYDGVPITRSVHDNHLCAVNPRFIAVITECAGGGAFLVLSINHTGKVDPHHPKVSGHRSNVLDIKWNPFNDFCIASCSEDSTVKIWDIPEHGVLKNITVPWKELQGHSRRVGLIEWHPTANNIIFSTGYDYQVMVWKLDVPEQVIKNPVRSISVHSDVVLSMSFNTDGSRLATSCKDKKIRVIDPRTGTLLQETNCKSHKASKVLFLGNLKMLLSTGNSRWNHRQIALWDQEDLTKPSYSEDLDGSSGVLFPFYDPDTHMLYIAGKGDGNIRYYEISPEKPYVHYLTEYRSLLPQKGMGPVMMSLRPGSKLDSYVELGSGKDPTDSMETQISRSRPGLSQLIQERQDAKEVNTRRETPSTLLLPSTDERSSSTTYVSNGQLDSTHCSPPKTENELRQMFYKQQDEIRRLREQLNQKDVRIKQLELEIKNVRNSHATL